MLKVATLKHNDIIYNYFERDDDGDFGIIRVDPQGNQDTNPYWEYDILTDDIVYSDIIYLNGVYADFYISEKDYHELWNELFEDGRSSYNADEIVSKIKAYTGGENNA